MSLDISVRQASKIRLSPFEDQVGQAIEEKEGERRAEGLCRLLATHPVEKSPYDFWRALRCIEHLNYRQALPDDKLELIRSMVETKPPQNLSFLSQNQLFDLSRAVRTLGLAKTPLLGLLVEACAEVAHKFSPTQLVIILGELESFGANLDRFNLSIRREVRKRATQFQDAHLSQLEREGALDRQEGAVATMLSDQSTPLATRIERLRLEVGRYAENAGALISLFRKASQLYRHNSLLHSELSDLPRIFLPAILRSGQELEPETLGDFATALKNFNLAVPPYFVQIKSVLRGSLKDVDLADLAEIATAATLLQNHDRELYSIISDRASWSIPYSNNFSATRKLICALVHERFFEQSVYDAACYCLVDHHSEFLPIDRALVARELARAKAISSDELIKIVATEISNGFESPVLALRFFSESLAILNENFPAYFEGLTQALALRKEELSDTDAKIFNNVYSHFGLNENVIVH